VGFTPFQQLNAGFAKNIEIDYDLSKKYVPLQLKQ
jgi:hypothetical protein